jgi:hypothetical protein
MSLLSDRLAKPTICGYEKTLIKNCLSLLQVLAGSQSCPFAGMTLRFSRGGGGRKTSHCLTYFPFALVFLFGLVSFFSFMVYVGGHMTIMVIHKR